MDITKDLLQIKYYNKGVIKILNEEEKSKVLEKITMILSKSIEMPCFYVSLDNEIKEMLKTDSFIEFIYSKQKNHNGYKYERLLLKIEDKIYNLNFARYYNNKYEGRNLYFDIDKKDIQEKLI